MNDVRERGESMDHNLLRASSSVYSGEQRLNDQEMSEIFTPVNYLPGIRDQRVILVVWANIDDA